MIGISPCSRDVFVPLLNKLVPVCWIHSWLVITFGEEAFHSRFEQEWRPTGK